MLAIGTVAGSSRGTSVTCGNNAEGSWTELVASLSADIDGFTLLGNLTGGNMAKMDVGIGAAGSEVVVAGDLAIIGRQGSPVGAYDVPIPIAAGSRIAVRGIGIGAAPTAIVSLLGWVNGSVPMPTYTALTTHGFSAASSPGVSVDPGGSANTKGSWTQLVASTALDYEGLIVALTNLNDFAAADATWLVDIGTGGAGAETVLIPDLYAGMDSGNDFAYPLGGLGPFAVDIPAGTRIAARAQSTTTTAGDRPIGVVVYGLSGGSAGGGGGGTTYAGGLVL